MRARKHSSSKKKLSQNQKCVVFRPTPDVLPHILFIPEEDINFIWRMTSCTQNNKDDHLNGPTLPSYEVKTNKKDSSFKNHNATQI